MPTSNLIVLGAPPEPEPNIANAHSHLAPGDHLTQNGQFVVVEEQVPALSSCCRHDYPLSQIEVEVGPGEARGRAQIARHIEPGQFPDLPIEGSGGVAGDEIIR